LGNGFQNRQIAGSTPAAAAKYNIEKVGLFGRAGRLTC